MKLSTKEKGILDSLIKIDKRIFKCITDILYHHKTDLVKNGLQNLIESEEKLINLITIDDQKYELILDYLGVQDVDRTTGILSSASTYTDGSRYARVRIISHFYYKLMSTKTLGFDSLYNNIVDKQVALLYNILMDECEKCDLMSSPKIRMLSLITLSDSPNAEKTFLNTKYGDDLVVYDTTRIATDLIVFRIEKERKRCFPGLPILYIKEPYSTCPDDVITNYYNKTLNIIVNGIMRIINNDDDYKCNTRYIYLVSYLKSVIAMYSKQYRENKYQVLDEFLKRFDKKEYLEALKDLIDDVENSIIPKIIYARIHPMETPPHIHK